METIGKIGALICLTILSATFYRAGGMDKEPTTNPKWIPVWARHSWIRDWLCPFCVYLSVAILLPPSHILQWLMLLICYPLLGGASSTYLDSIFGYDNFWAAGFLCGIAAFPLIWYGLSFWAILIRAVALGIAWGLWCKNQSVDFIEEEGRGAFLVLTVPLLFL